MAYEININLILIKGYDDLVRIWLNSYNTMNYYYYTNSGIIPEFLYILLQCFYKQHLRFKDYIFRYT